MSKLRVLPKLMTISNARQFFDRGFSIGPDFLARALGLAGARAVEAAMDLFRQPRAAASDVARLYAHRGEAR